MAQIISTGNPSNPDVIAAVGLVTGTAPLLSNTAVQMQGIYNNLKSATDSFVSWNIPNATVAQTAVTTLNTDLTSNSNNFGYDASIAFNYANQVATYAAAQMLVRDIVANGCPGTPNVVGTFQASYKAGGFLKSSTFVINNQYDALTQAAVNEILQGSMGTGPVNGTSAPPCAGQTDYPYPTTTTTPVSTTPVSTGTTTVVNTPAASSTGTTVAVVAGTAVAVTALGVLAAYLMKAGPFVAAGEAMENPVLTDKQKEVLRKLRVNTSRGFWTGFGKSDMETAKTLVRRGLAKRRKDAKGIKATFKST